MSRQTLSGRLRKWVWKRLRRFRDHTCKTDRERLKMRSRKPSSIIVSRWHITTTSIRSESLSEYTKSRSEQILLRGIVEKDSCRRRRVGHTLHVFSEKRLDVMNIRGQVIFECKES